MVAQRVSSRRPVIIMLFALGVLLLFTGSGIASGMAYWGPLFDDQQLLRLVTNVLWEKQSSRGRDSRHLVLCLAKSR